MVTVNIYFDSEARFVFLFNDWFLTYMYSSLCRCHHQARRGSQSARSATARCSEGESRQCRLAHSRHRVQPTSHSNQPRPNIRVRSIIIGILLMYRKCRSVINVLYLFRLRPSAERFPVYVSQDCGHAPTADVIRSYGDKLTHLQVRVANNKT